MDMVSAGYHKVANLCGRRETWRLRLKLVRQWKMSAVATPDDPFAMHMLFVDQEGNRIEAVIQKHMMHRFNNSALEGEVYNVTNFTVTRNNGMFRATQHDYKLSFGANTRIVPCPTISVPDNGLNLVKTSAIMKTKGSSQYLIVTGISEKLTLNKQGRQTRLMLIDLVDEMGKIRCAIFGQLIDTVKGYLSLPRDSLPVLIIQLACVNLYRGEVGIQNLMNASRLLWNPELPMALEFMNGLAVHEIETDMEISLISDNARPISIREQFLSSYPRRRVGDLTPLLEDGSYVFHGTITEVFQEDDWWYMACCCMRAIDFSQGFPYCDGCKREVFDITPRYKIKVLVSDDFDAIELIMFDSECYFLINIPCKQLLSDSKAKQCVGYPDEIMDFIGHDFLFRIDVKADRSSTFDDDSIKVQKICSDPSIIKDYKELIEDETPLKFALAFSKYEKSGGESCVLDLTPNTLTIGSQDDLNTPGSGQSSAAPSTGDTTCKRPSDGKDDEPCEKRRRGKARVIKVEKT